LQCLKDKTQELTIANEQNRRLAVIRCTRYIGVATSLIVVLVALISVKARNTVITGNSRTKSFYIGRKFNWSDTKYGHPFLFHSDCSVTPEKSIE